MYWKVQLMYCSVHSQVRAGRRSSLQTRTGTLTVEPAAAAHRITTVGQTAARYGLVVVLAWIGLGKFVKMEAHVLIEHSPLMSWVYQLLSHHTVAAALGTAEIVAAVLIAVRPLWPRLSAVGSAMAVVLFLGTLSFLFTTPGLIAGHAGPVPILGALPGQFLLKDLVLIGVSVWTLGDALGGSVPNVPSRAN
jgi:uncharacterized membrane protein YkgB